MEDMHRASEDIHATTLAPLVTKIRVSIGRVRTMKTKVTNIYSAADGIRDEAEWLHSEVLEALQEVDGLLALTGSLDSRHPQRSGITGDRSSTSCDRPHEDARASASERADRVDPRRAYGNRAGDNRNEQECSADDGEGHDVRAARCQRRTS